jgi:hypothetical protein
MPSARPAPALTPSRNPGRIPLACRPHGASSASCETRLIWQDSLIRDAEVPARFALRIPELTGRCRQACHATPNSSASRPAESP